MAELTAKARKKIPKKDFALPGGRYPVEDKAHARNALARVAQHGTPAEKAKVRAKVHEKYPGIGDGGKKGMATEKARKDERKGMKKEIAKKHVAKEREREHERKGEKKAMAHKATAREHESRGMKKAMKKHSGHHEGHKAVGSHDGAMMPMGGMKKRHK